jgi:hypothetical protein
MEGRMHTPWNGKDCTISTFQNEHEKPHLELDGSISPIIIASLPLQENRRFKGTFIQKENSFVIVKIGNRIMPIELAEQK